MDGSAEDEVTRPPEERDLIVLARESALHLSCFDPSTQRAAPISRCLHRTANNWRGGLRSGTAAGGLAINRLGYVRATDDIDLLIARDLANQQRVKQALEILPDKAVRDLGEDDLAQWLVVRVNDEITVDLMTEACGVGFDEASTGIEMVEIDGVPIPFAGAGLMLKMKQGAREKDGMDRKFLERLLAEKKRPE